MADERELVAADEPDLFGRRVGAQTIALRGGRLLASGPSVECCAPIATKSHIGAKVSGMSMLMFATMLRPRLRGCCEVIRAEQAFLFGRDRDERIERRGFVYGTCNERAISSIIAMPTALSCAPL